MGSIVYDKVLSKDLSSSEDDIIERDDKLSNDDYDNLLNEVKNIFDVVYTYQKSVNTYCGKCEKSEHQISMKLGNLGTYVSTQFKTYDELHSYLRKYMSEEVINNISNFKKEYYLEEDGKLYCADLGKGSPFSFGDSVVEIKSLNNDVITAIAIKELTVDLDNYYEKIKLTIEKENGNYIVTSYEELIKVY